MSATNFSDNTHTDMMRRLQELAGITKENTSRPNKQTNITSTVVDINDDLVTEEVSQIVAGLNPQQRASVLHDSGHLLVVAGAGSGKTRVLTRRIAYLIATGELQPAEILAITFTNKAAKEMRERLGELLGGSARQMWISTFHSACVRILRAEHEVLGFSSSFTIYDTADALRLMKIICAEEGIDPQQISPRTLLNRVSDLKNGMITPSDFAGTVQTAQDQILAKVYAGYQARLRVANAMDFDDLIMQTVLLFKYNDEVLRRYQQRFRHILVDEYQDTNVAQYELIYLLTGSGKKDVGVLLTAVGDADQSIYAFRGATIRNIENFAKDFPGATTILLEQNYRSTQNILSAANAVISHNENRQAKNLWTNSGRGEKLTGYVAESEHDEARYVANEIQKLSQQGMKYSDCAIFYRANAQSRALEEKLIRANIPYRVVGGTKFYDRKEIKDVLAYLRVVTNFADTVSFRRIFNEPKRGLGAKTEEAVLNHARKYNISFGVALQDVVTPSAEREALTVSAKATAAITDLLEILRDAQDLAVQATPNEVIDLLLDRTQYVEILQNSGDVQDEVRVENIAELSAVAEDYTELNPDDTLTDFLQQLSLASDTDQIPDSETGEVVLMTVHTAKGLEFPTVFVTGMEDGTFPHERSCGDEKELAEERRLAYVALTRAEKRLYVTRAETRFQWGSPQSLIPSRFLEEIPADVITWKYAQASGSNYSSGYGSYGAKYRRKTFVDEDFAPPIGSGKFKGGRLDTDASSPIVKDTSNVDIKGDFTVGDRVRHKSFGEGEILSFSGTGKSMVVKVKFDTGSTKRLMLRFAVLEKI